MPTTPTNTWRPSSACSSREPYRSTSTTATARAELLYLLDNADAEAIFFDAQFGPRLAAIRDRLPKLKLFVQIDDGSAQQLAGAVDFEGLIAGHERLPRQEHSEDDVYMLYTGGTTGMPKGVMYRQGDFTLGLGAAGLASGCAADPGRARRRRSGALHAAGEAPISLAACPLMHGTGLWLAVFIPHFLGGTAVTFRNEHFDPHALWRLVARERVTAVVIVGDAFAKPMLAALREAQAAGTPYDLSSLKQIISSGVMFSPR